MFRNAARPVPAKGGGWWVPEEPVVNEIPRATPADVDELQVLRHGVESRQDARGFGSPRGAAYASAFRSLLSGNKLGAAELRTLAAALPDDWVALDKDDARDIRMGRAKRGTEYFRGDLDGLVERRDLGLGTGAAGGYMVPQSIYDTIIVALQAYSPVFKLARIWQTPNARQAKVPVVAGDFANPAVIQAENSQIASNTDPVFTNTLTLGGYPFVSKIIRYPIALAQDALVPDITPGNAVRTQDTPFESWLATLLAERIGRGLGAQLVTGTGTSMPQGIVNATQGATTTDAGGVTFTALLALWSSIDPAYLAIPGASWLMNATTYRQILALQDTTNRPLNLVKYLPGDGPFGSILGTQVAIVPEMDSFGAGAGKKPVILGNLRQGYVVRVAGPPAMHILQERYGDFLQRGAFMSARFDAGILDSRAIRALVTT